MGYTFRFCSAGGVDAVKREFEIGVEPIAEAHREPKGDGERDRLPS